MTKYICFSFGGKAFLIPSITTIHAGVFTLYVCVTESSRGGRVCFSTGLVDGQHFHLDNVAKLFSFDPLMTTNVGRISGLTERLPSLMVPMASHYVIIFNHSVWL